jgi:hypothetical protein
LFHIVHTLISPSAQSWVLFPSRHPTCVLGRHCKPTNDDQKFVAALYSMGKGGVKSLDLGPEIAPTRKQVLIQLLEAVETEIGVMMVNDKKQKRDKERERGGSGSRN